jgi:hypothetical protein
MEVWLGLAFDAACCAANAAAERVLEVSSSSSTAGSGLIVFGSSSAASWGTPNTAVDVLEVLQVDQTVQLCCLETVVLMLAQHLQGLSTDIATNSGTSSSGGGSNIFREQWMPAVLAPSMPAACSSMLNQLGISRQVGLWMAMQLNGHTGQTAEHRSEGLSVLQLESKVAAGLQKYSDLLQELSRNETDNLELAALHLHFLGGN